MADAATDVMLGSAKNRKVAEEIESQRADENPESIASSDIYKLASTGAAISFFNLLDK